MVLWLVVISAGCLLMIAVWFLLYYCALLFCLAVRVGLLFLCSGGWLFAAVWFLLVLACIGACVVCLLLLGGWFGYFVLLLILGW